MKKTLFILVFIAAIGCSAWSQTIVRNGVTYLLSSQHYALVQGYDNSAAVLVIPDTVMAGSSVYTVTIISSRAFANCTTLVDITLPSTLTRIENAAFNGCQALTAITMLAATPPSLYYTLGSGIGSLTINVPCGSIHAYQAATVWSMYANSILTPIDCPVSVGDTFSLPYNEQRLYYKVSHVEPYEVELTNPWCWTNHSWVGIAHPTTIVAPDSVTWDSVTFAVTGVGEFAFAYCDSLASITLPNSVTYLGQYAFKNCYNLTHVELPSALTSIGIEAFGNCTSLDTLVIPETVTYLGRGTFYQCASLVSVNLPNAIDTIGFSTFCSCSSLASLRLPDSLRMIQASAFANCSTLTEITIPPLVDDMSYGGAAVFSNCTSLATIRLLPPTPPALQTNEFQNLHPEFIIYVPCGSLTAYQTAPGWSNIDFRMAEHCIDTIAVAAQMPWMGVVTGSGVYERGDTIELTAQATDIRYTFTGWDDGDTHATRQVVVSGNATYTALFTYSDVTYIIAVEGEEWGTTDPAPGTYTLHYGDESMYDWMAVAAEHGRYLHWIVNDRDSILMPGVGTNYDTADAGRVWRLTCCFAEAPKYSISVTMADTAGTVGDYGVIYGEGSYYDEETVSLTVSAHPGYTFLYWVDTTGSILSYRDNCRVTLAGSDLEVRAIFVPNNRPVGIGDAAADATVFAVADGVVVRGAEGREVRLYDLTGRLTAYIRSAAAEEHLPVSAAGIYLIQVGRTPAIRIAVQ